jgi:hypothetical protein
MTKYICKRYEDLKDDENILAFGVHVLRWNFAKWGNPAYGFVPAKEEQAEFQSDNEPRGNQEYEDENE